MTPKSMWFWPNVLAILTTIGLLVALVSDGAGDIVSAVALAVPVATCIWFGTGWRRQRRQGNAR
jgi:hypothetical protein